ncbi:MAG: T9SS type A sorting domain-containing protein [Lentimicrobiaceae bacterium]|nr:T9SS type A sorting domain-containing protein [Lentimicrobiaceae bacterium]
MLIFTLPNIRIIIDKLSSIISKNAKYYKTFPILYLLISILILRKDKPYEDFPNEAAKTIIYKLDSNGDTLWSKLLISQYDNQIQSICSTSDGGIAGSGFIYPEDIVGESKPFVFKLNACAELEWCSIFETDRFLSWAQNILQTDDGEYLVTLNSFGDYDYENTFLAKLDATGETVWCKPVINHNVYSDAYNPYSDRMIRTINGDFLITGKVFWKNPFNDVIPLRPFYALYKSNGQELWVSPFGLSDTLIGRAYDCLEYENGNFLCAARQFTNGLQMGLIIELDSNGSILQFRSVSPDEISDDCYSLFFTDIEQVKDTITIEMQYLISSSEYYPSVISFGADIFNEELPVNSMRMYYDKLDDHRISKTSDDKIILGNRQSVSNYDTDIFITKLSGMLITDSIVQNNRKYDSLCPHTITSGEIFIGNCKLVTNIIALEYPGSSGSSFNPEFTVYPNPCGNNVQIIINEKTVNDRVDINVYTIHGTLFTNYACKDRAQLNIDVSGWPYGIYPVQVYRNGIFIGTQKLIKL